MQAQHKYRESKELEILVGQVQMEKQEHLFMKMKIKQYNRKLTLILAERMKRTSNDTNPCHQKLLTYSLDEEYSNMKGRYMTVQQQRWQ